MKISFIPVLLLIFAVFISGCALFRPATIDQSKDTVDTMTDKTDTAMVDKTPEAKPVVDSTTKDSIANAYVDVSPAEAKELIETMPNLVVIDVSPHYAAGHLPRAVNYYLGDGSLDTAIPTLDKNVPYLVYCHVDSVSITGAQKLIDAGFAQVYRLEGNYSAWVAAGRIRMRIGLVYGLGDKERTASWSGDQGAVPVSDRAADIVMNADT